VTNPERRYHFYIMASRSRTLYCGVTSKLEKRVWQHKNHRLSGFTDRYNIERLVYFERYSDIRNAINREKQIKRWSRQKKLALIEGANPTWLDLSEGWYQQNLSCTETRMQIPRLAPQHRRRSLGMTILWSRRADRLFSLKLET